MSGNTCITFQQQQQLLQKQNEQQRIINEQSQKQKMLQLQLQSSNKLQDLISMANKRLSCDQDCQKRKVAEQLKQSYLNSKTKLQTAPIEYENNKKKYYTFIEGDAYYNDMQEKELKNKVNDIAKSLTDVFNEQVYIAKTLNSYLNTALINKKNSIELYNSYKNDNEELIKEIKNNKGDILTNDRKTYYESQEYENLQKWYNLLWWLYYILIFIFLLAILLVESEMSMIKKGIIFVLLILYPYIVSYIVTGLYKLYLGVKSYSPKNVYTNL
jgi:hypothetical protein